MFMISIAVNLRKKASAFAACAAVYIFLLQGLAAASFQHSRGPFFDDAASASASAAGQLCDAQGASHGTDQTPAQHRHQFHHCALCGVGGRDALWHPVATITSVIVLAFSPSEPSPAWIRRDEPRRRPLGWRSTWSSRAPPFVS
jgi:hypothetical protein